MIQAAKLQGSDRIRRIESTDEKSLRLQAAVYRDLSAPCSGIWWQGSWMPVPNMRHHCVECPRMPPLRGVRNTRGEPLHLSGTCVIVTPEPGRIEQLEPAKLSLTGRTLIFTFIELVV